MKVAIVTGLLAKRDVYVNASHDVGGNFYNFIRTMRFVVLFCVLLLGQVVNLQAQIYRIALHQQDTDNNTNSAAAPSASGTFNAADALAFIQKIIPALQSQGHLAASLDSVKLENEQYDVWYFMGPKFRAARILLDSLPQELFSENIVTEKQWQPEIWQPSKFAKLSERILRYYENAGYPFAQVRLQDVVVEPNGEVQGTLYARAGEFRKIDSVVLLGNSNVRPEFLYKYLDVRPGVPYSEKKLMALSTRIRELPYLQERKPWYISFNHFDTHLNLFIDERKANQLNAIIGLQPNTQVTGKFLLTVDAQFSFKNLLGRGEQFALVYQNLQYRSPRLRISGQWPYLFQTDFGADLQFELFRNDLLFRRSALTAGLSYRISAKDELRIFYQTQSNRLLFVDTQLLKQSFQLPANADYNSKGLGISATINRTDYRINPRKGWSVEATLLGNKRRVRENEDVLRLSDNQKDFKKLYDSANVHHTQAHLTTALMGYLPIAKNISLKTAYHLGYIYGEDLFRNELYQIGGQRLLRGFDEQSLFVNQYHLLVTELRYFLNVNSYLHVFSDNAYLVSRFSGNYNEGLFYGFGVGASLENKSGIFSITYALGGTKDSPVQLRQSKIHFGYLAFF